MISIKFIDSIQKISKFDWGSVAEPNYPFIRYEFLAALESSGAIHATTGWWPHHTLVYYHDELIAIMPTYLKSHSYGEFVFDFQWAEAYKQRGLDYYPKLISAIPFSPVTGPRICIKRGVDVDTVLGVLIDVFVKTTNEKNISSWHILFPDKKMADQLVGHGLLLRKSVHFQWNNNNYDSFENFLLEFNSRHRKNLRKERKKVEQQGIVLQRLEGSEITSEYWQSFYRFYQLTQKKYRGHSGYLNADFFYAIGREMPHQLMMVLAKKNEVVIAAALNFKDTNTLYGRYWGCSDDFDFLHFEVCYYQGIEYCIENKLQRFDPGAQGEHKIQRGFRPVFTYSNHWIVNPHFREGIRQFLQREEKQINIYQKEAESWLPFKHF